MTTSIKYSVYMKLEEVFNRGYNNGDGFKQKGLLSDFLKTKEYEITNIVLQAYKDELVSKMRLNAVHMDNFKENVEAIDLQTAINIIKGEV